MNFFEVRDRLDHFMLGTDLPSMPVAWSLLRLLLEHTFYRGDMEGWVNRKVLGVHRLARLSGYGEKTIRRALGDLEEAGFIVKHPRVEKGTRVPDDIWMEILIVWYPAIKGQSDL